MTTETQRTQNALPEAVERSAKNWLKRHLLSHGITPSVNSIRTALEAYARTVSGHTFVRQRNDLVRFYAYRARTDDRFKNVPARIRAIQNPVPADQRKPKRRKRKGCSTAEFDALMDDAIGRKDEEMVAALWAVAATGARPGELHTLTLTRDPDWSGGPLVRISGGKQAVIQGNERGVPVRELRIEDKALLGQLIYRIGQLQHLKGKRLNNLQKRFERAAKRLWPKRKSRPTLYSLRHQLGSDLKASGLSDAERAAIMGHLSQSSIETYGYVRSGKERKIKATEETVNQVKSDPPRSRTLHNRIPPGKAVSGKEVRLKP